MQQSINKRYKDYCRSEDAKEEIFRMILEHDESLEYYEERFQLSYERAGCTLDLESLKLVLLRGIREDLLETLNMLSGREIYKLAYDDIKIVFKNHSREAKKKGRASQALTNSSSSNTSIKSEIGSMLEDFKSEMLHTLADIGGYWWPPAYSTWNLTIVSFNFLVSLIVAEFTIFGNFSSVNFQSCFEALCWVPIILVITPLLL